VCLIVRIGNQLIVFRAEGNDGPRCTAMAKTRGERCRVSLMYLEGCMFQEVIISGADGWVYALPAGKVDSECWVRQRCPKHLDSERAVTAPEWTLFDFPRDADLISRLWPIWTPQGVGGAREAWPEASAAPSAPVNDEQLDLLTRALAVKVEPDAATALYRYFDEKDRLLYVGITDHLLGRTEAHVLGSSWMDYAVRSTIARYPTRREAEDAERAAIKAERPLFNDIHNRTPEARKRLVEYLVEHGRIDLLTPSVSRG
jgi:hypothetical protein